MPAEMSKWEKHTPSTEHRTPKRQKKAERIKVIKASNRRSRPEETKARESEDEGLTARKYAGKAKEPCNGTGTGTGH